MIDLFGQQWYLKSGAVHVQKLDPESGNMWRFVVARMSRIQRSRYRRIVEVFHIQPWPQVPEDCALESHKQSVIKSPINRKQSVIKIDP